jgi:hypothetical protein
MAGEILEDLFKPFSLGTIELANRFVFPPVKLGYGNPDGTVTDRQVRFSMVKLRKRALPSSSWSLFPLPLTEKSTPGNSVSTCPKVLPNSRKLQMPFIKKTALPASI